MIRVVHVALASCLLMSGVASAAAPVEGWFIGGAVGTSEADGKAFGLVAPTLSTDDSDTAWQVWGGYRLASWVAIQGRYTDLGEFSSVIDNGTATGGNNSFDSQGLTVDLKLIWPFGNSGVDVYAQLGLGVADWQGDFAELSGPPLKPATSLSSKEPLVTYGAGIRWTIIPALTVSLAVDAYQFEGKAIREFPNPDTGATLKFLTEAVKFDADILTTNLGLQYNF